jgi:hypothetical protein
MRIRWVASLATVSVVNVNRASSLRDDSLPVRNVARPFGRPPVCAMLKSGGNAHGSAG